MERSLNVSPAQSIAVPSQHISLDAQAQMMYDADKKSMIVSYLLLFFLGYMGAHRFYLQKAGSAAAMLALSIVSFFLSFVFIGVFGFLIVFTWVFIDIFLIPGMVSSWNRQLIGRITGKHVG